MTETHYKILMVEDNAGDARLVRELLNEVKASRTDLSHVETYAEAQAKLASSRFDLVLLDMSLPDGEGLEMIQSLKKISGGTPVIIMTGRDDDEFAINALKAGAQDYLIKGQTDGEGLHRALRYSIEREHIKEDLRFQKTLLECEGESSLDGILRIGADGRIHSANSRFMSIWNVSSDNLKGTAGGLFAMMARQVTEGASFLEKITTYFSSDLPHASGECEQLNGLFLEYNVTLIRNTQGKYYGRSFNFRDLSERKKLERMKDDFISTVSHELRTPLAIIKGAVGNLKDGILGPMTEKQTRVIETTDRNITRLARLINDLLDLSRLESGRTTIRLGDVDASGLIKDLVSSFQAECTAAGLTLSSSIEGDVVKANADGDMIIQVLVNLIGNAIRYAKTSITVSLTKKKRHAVFGDGKPASDVLVFSIKDDGPGIPQEFQAELFSKFLQINRPSGGEGYKGTGLGLAICKEIVGLHHGRIWVNSEEGKGATFSFEIPIN